MQSFSEQHLMYSPASQNKVQNNFYDLYLHIILDLFAIIELLKMSHYFGNEVWIKGE